MADAADDAPVRRICPRRADLRKRPVGRFRAPDEAGVVVALEGPGDLHFRVKSVVLCDRPAKRDVGEAGAEIARSARACVLADRFIDHGDVEGFHELMERTGAETLAHRQRLRRRIESDALLRVLHVETRGDRANVVDADAIDRRISAEPQPRREEPYPSDPASARLDGQRYERKQKNERHEHRRKEIQQHADEGQARPNGDGRREQQEP
ncbi:MAG: hypothetical protein HZY79_12215 [Rhodoblastus sp.]|nr:MAG: hypothetical protein HZY79_12215 [Rhodoblastus sp.]